jgi:RNA polymerase sigma-70 factor, ECF subfamily
MDTSTERMQKGQESQRDLAALTPQFHAIFETEFDYVCRSLRRLGVRDGDLKDVAQELFVSVHSHLHTFDPSRAIRPWLFAFAVRYASNYRKLARNQARETDEHDAHAVPTESAHEARDLVQKALEALDFDRRTVIVMHDFDGFDAPEIASELGIPLNTVYSRIRLGRTDFRNAVTHLQGGAS